MEAVARTTPSTTPFAEVTWSQVGIEGMPLSPLTTRGLTVEIVLSHPGSPVAFCRAKARVGSFNYNSELTVLIGWVGRERYACHRARSVKDVTVAKSERRNRPALQSFSLALESPASSDPNSSRVSLCCGGWFPIAEEIACPKCHASRIRPIHKSLCHQHQIESGACPVAMEDV